MLWVIVFGSIALAGLIVLLCFAVWLAHKASDVMSEVAMVAANGEKLVDLLGQIKVPDLGSGPGAADDFITVDLTRD